MKNFFMEEEETSCFICFEPCDISTHCCCKLHVCNACLLKSLENKPNICTICKTSYNNVKTKFQMHKIMKSSNVRLCIVNIIVIISSFSASMVLLFYFYTLRHVVLGIAGFFFAIYSFVIIYIFYLVRHNVCVFPDLFEHHVMST